MKTTLIILTLLLSACAGWNPQAESTEQLCNAYYRGSGEYQEGARAELARRQIDGQTCGNLMMAQQQRAMQMLGIGSYLLTVPRYQPRY